MGSGGSLIYRPRARFVGSDTFTYARTYARRGVDRVIDPMDARMRILFTVTE